ncbi:hypothetical protein F4677DRAFT_414434 [Hypoxylon crocopeplum]|nr:hypothetical protein F4677DRAFT_414434 [Hypoxylon crocopeplum]
MIHNPSIPVRIAYIYPGLRDGFNEIFLTHQHTFSPSSPNNKPTKLCYQLQHSLLHLHRSTEKMRSSTFFASVLSWTAATVYGQLEAPPNQGGLLDGYRSTNMTWKGSITDNGPEASFTGSSFQDIEAQILRANPAFTWPAQDSTPTLAKGDRAYVTCDPNGIWWAQVFRIQEGIDYLSGKSGQCYIGGGPRVCTRISCSYKSGISWCNDNEEPLWIDCALWSAYAQDIVDQCQTHDASSRVRGQEFDNDSWNILVGYDPDHY